MRGETISQEEMLAIPAEEISDPGRLSAEPLVSVIVITYNHEAYLKDCLEGILAQRCNFPLEVIVGEDKSPDRTLEICLDYQKRYPHLFRVLTWRENLGPNANFLRCWGRARGKYVAICEGDDYWIDPDKLTKQVAVMEKFTDTTMCGARSIVKNTIRTKKASNNKILGPVKIKSDLSLFSKLYIYQFHTSTFIIRNFSIKFPKATYNIKYLDHFIHCLHILYGKERCLHDIVSIYRVNETGITLNISNSSNLELFESIFTSLLQTVNDSKKRFLINREIYRIRRRKCDYLIENGNIKHAKKIASRIILPLLYYDFIRAFLLILNISLPFFYPHIRKYINYIKR